jgi:chromosome partitioning protein
MNKRGGKREGAGRKKVNKSLKRDKQWRISVNEKELEILNKKYDAHAKQILIKNLIKGEKNMLIISILNQKGGIGKTTSVRNIGYLLSKKGKKVLLIDMDQQGNLTTSFGIDKRELKYTIYDLLKDTAQKDYTLPTEDVIINVQKNLDIIPSNIHLARADYFFGNVRGREYLLKEILKDVSYMYDYCLIDCPPNLGVITDNALVASNRVYVPIKAEKFALEGINDLLDTIEDVKKFFNSEVEISGVFLNQLKARTNLHEVLTNEIKEYFGDKVLKTTIRDSIKIAEASALNQSITEYAPTSSVAKDFKKLVDEILEREEG